MGIADWFKRKSKSAARFPPVPDWKPDFSPSIDEIVERLQYYTDGQRDIAVFRHGTCVVLEDELSDEDATAFALQVLSNVFNYHPDMAPAAMDDGNVLVQYNHPAVNVVIDSHVVSHWEAIEQHHLRALATDEVLMTPDGANAFDDLFKKALYGRCFMFMDGQAPEVTRIVRKASE